MSKQLLSITFVVLLMFSKSVMHIPNFKAFAGVDLEEVAEFPIQQDGVEYSIHGSGEAILENCYDDAIERIVIPEFVEKDGRTYIVTEIGYEAFCACDKLKYVVLPNSVKKIGNEVFWYCKNLKFVKLSDHLEEIGIEAFKDCVQLKEIEIPKSIISIGERAFDGCNTLKEVKVYKQSSIIYENIFSKEVNIIRI